MKKYLLVTLLLLLVPASVNAQSVLTKWLNIPAEWTNPPEVIYFVFIPFLGTFTIIWGLLTSTRAPIFRNQKVNILLSFVFAIALFYSGILPAIVLYLFTFGGFFGVIAFFVLFFVLTFLFGSRKVRTEYFKTLKVYEKAAGERRREIDKIKDVDKKLEALRKERAELVAKREDAEFMYDKIEGMGAKDPELERLGLTKHEALKQTRDTLRSIERHINETDDKIKEILRKKKRMRES